MGFIKSSLSERASVAFRDARSLKRFVLPESVSRKTLAVKKVFFDASKTQTVNLDTAIKIPVF